MTLAAIPRDADLYQQTAVEHGSDDEGPARVLAGQAGHNANR
jgi:hypothetical protein